MLTALNAHTGAPISVYAYKAMSPHDRPGALVCPGQSVEGDACTTTAPAREIIHPRHPPAKTLYLHHDYSPTVPRPGSNAASSALLSGTRSPTTGSSNASISDRRKSR